MKRLFVLALVVAPGLAHAEPGYPFEIPNGSRNRCSNCHVRASGGGTRNAFGLDVEDNIAGVNNFGDAWAAVCDLDSDGDGQTNGQELGDPDCVWTSGTPSRTDDISLPGDPSSTSANPDGGAGGGGGGEGEGEGGGGGDGCGGSAQAALALPALLLLRRRRR